MAHTETVNQVMVYADPCKILGSGRVGRSFGQTVSPVNDSLLLRPNVLPLGDEFFEFFGKSKTQFKKSLGIDADAAERIWSAEN